MLTSFDECVSPLSHNHMKTIPQWTHHHPSTDHSRRFSSVGPCSARSAFIRADEPLIRSEKTHLSAELNLYTFPPSWFNIMGSNVCQKWISAATGIRNPKFRKPYHLLIRCVECRTTGNGALRWDGRGAVAEMSKKKKKLRRRLLRCDRVLSGPWAPQHWGPTTRLLQVWSQQWSQSTTTTTNLMITACMVINSYTRTKPGSPRLLLRKH